MFTKTLNNTNVVGVVEMPAENAMNVPPVSVGPVCSHGCGY